MFILLPILLLSPVLCNNDDIQIFVTDLEYYENPMNFTIHFMETEEIGCHHIVWGSWPIKIKNDETISIQSHDLILCTWEHFYKFYNYDVLCYW